MIAVPCAEATSSCRLCPAAWPSAPSFLGMFLILTFKLLKKTLLSVSLSVVSDFLFLTVLKLKTESDSCLFAVWIWEEDQCEWNYDICFPILFPKLVTTQPSFFPKYYITQRRDTPGWAEICMDCNLLSSISPARPMRGHPPTNQPTKYVLKFRLLKFKSRFINFKKKKDTVSIIKRIILSDYRSRITQDQPIQYTAVYP